MTTKDKFLRLLGIKPKRIDPIIEVGDDPEALAKTGEALPKPPLTIDPGQALQGVTTDDVDPATGRVYPDYLARRDRREAARKAGAEAAELCVLDWDTSPR